MLRTRTPALGFKIVATTTDVCGVTADQISQASAPAAAAAANGVDPDALTATILTAVEKQLTRYFASMSRQADAAKHTAETTRAAVDERLPLVEAAVDAQREGFEAYQLALQGALEERLTEFANHQHWRLVDLEEKISLVPTSVGLSTEDMLEIRQTVRDDMERTFQAINAKLEDLSGNQRRFDEHAAQVVVQLGEATATLVQRMDDGDQRIAEATTALLDASQESFAATLTDIEAQVLEHTGTLLQKLESAESRATDRLLALEARVTEEQGTKLANLEATVGRIGAGFDDAMVAINQRVLELENRLLLVGEQLDALAATVSRIDQDAIEDVKSQLSTAIGEAMLVRIELDRMVGTSEEKFGKQAQRMAEIEALLQDEMDVGTAVQLERLDELERAVAMLDPTKYTGSPLAPIVAKRTHSSMFDAPEDPGPVGPITGSTHVTMPSFTLNPRLPGSDARHGDEAPAPSDASGTHDQDATYTSH